jgi:predicted Zn-dependent protease with MMP-like domain
VDITLDEFEVLVAEAMDGVPEPFASAMHEVAVVIEQRSPSHMGTLFGLYQGVPLTHGNNPSGFLPPQISIYVHPMVDVCHTREDLIEQVRITVLHELGHHLGMDEDQLEELGYG